MERQTPPPRTVFDAHERFSHLAALRVRQKAAIDERINSNTTFEITLLPTSLWTGRGSESCGLAKRCGAAKARVGHEVVGQQQRQTHQRVVVCASRAIPIDGSPIV